MVETTQGYESSLGKDLWVDARQQHKVTKEGRTGLGLIPCFPQGKPKATRPALIGKGTRLEFGLVPAESSMTQPQDGGFETA